jgi:hypothetical protein
MEQTVFVLDEERLTKDFIEAYNAGKVTIRDGVGYWAKGSGNTGIIKHLPFKEAPYEGVKEALKKAQLTNVLTTAASTSVILGAIVVQTRYLASKLETLQEQVDVIAQDQHSANIVFYLEKVTSYAGLIASARTLLIDRNVIDECMDVASSLLASLLIQRNQILSFVDNLLSYAGGIEVSPRYYNLVVNFVQAILDVVPSAAHLEFLLSDRMGRFGLSEILLREAREGYERGLLAYKSFLVESKNSIIKGSFLLERKQVFDDIEEQALLLFNSEMNAALMRLPEGKVAVESKPHEALLFG